MNVFLISPRKGPKDRFTSRWACLLHNPRSSAGESWSISAAPQDAQRQGWAPTKFTRTLREPI